MKKIRIQSSEEITIEVNDKGDTISLDPLDLDFPLRLNKGIKELEKKTDLFKQAIVVIDKREDVQEGNGMTRNQEDKFLKYSEYLTTCGQIIDQIFGEDTCKKVFGGKKYFGMYEDFINAIEPIIKETYGSTDAVLDRIKKKYSKENSDVL